MSEDETISNMKASEELESKNAENLAKKFRLIDGEEIHLTKKPSTFAFVSMYGLGILVLGLHFMFGRADTLGEDSQGIMAFIYWFIDITTSDSMSFSFIFIMVIHS